MFSKVIAILVAGGHAAPTSSDLFSQITQISFPSSADKLNALHDTFVRHLNEQPSGMANGMEEMMASGNPEDMALSTICANPMLQLMCDQGTVSSNDQAASLPPGSDMCPMNAMLGFFCDGMCTEECDQTFGSKKSGNDEADGDLMQDLSQACTGGCMPTVITAMKAMVKAQVACPAPNNNATAGGAENSPDGASGINVDQLESGLKPLNTVCQKNEKGETCIQVIGNLTKQFESNAELDMATVTCETPELKAILGIGCCLGSMLAVIPAEGQDDASKAEMSMMGYHVVKCGGSLMPCSDGAVNAPVIIKSSLTIKAGIGCERMIEANAR
jgi:hypothetical protein